MLAEFAAWYAGRMSELLPARLRERRHGLPDGLVAVVSPPDRLRFLARTRGRELDLPDPPPTGRPWPEVMLQLPRGMMLERVVTLPLAAETGLERVVSYEMDRYTPFAAEELYWSVETVARDREQERLRARILFVPRATVAPAQAALATRRLTPTMVQGLTQDGVLRQVSLRAPDPRARRRAGLLLGGVTGVAALLLILAAALPFVRQSWESDAVDAQIAALQPRVDAADALRRRLLADSAGSDALASERVRLGEPLQTISKITQLLPDDTYLTALTLHQRQISIEGVSNAAARLIGLLSTDPAIRDPAFAAPVTRGDEGGDVFSIKAESRS